LDQNLPKGLGDKGKDLSFLVKAGHVTVLPPLPVNTSAGGRLQRGLHTHAGSSSLRNRVKLITTISTLVFVYGSCWSVKSLSWPIEDKGNALFCVGRNKLTTSIASRLCGLLTSKVCFYPWWFGCQDIFLGWWHI
jgi:hypothetical protein